MFRFVRRAGSKALPVSRANAPGPWRGCRNEAVYGSLAVSATAAVALALQASQENTTTSKCSGIIGVIGRPTCDAREVLIDGLSILKSRGYDSAGLATMPHDGQGPLVITKCASDQELNNDSIELVRTKSLPSRQGHSIGIAHTRWATAGAKTDTNAHPHTDASGRIAVVHNGALYNADALRAWLEKQGYEIWGDTDTEVIAKLIGHFYYQNKKHKDGKCGSLKEAVQKALDYCDGTWGLAVICVDEPDKIVVAMHGSSLLVGLLSGNTTTQDDKTPSVLVSSDHQALCRYTQTIIPLEESEIMEIDAAGMSGAGREYDHVSLASALAALDAANY